MRTMLLQYGIFSRMGLDGTFLEFVGKPAGKTYLRGWFPVKIFP